MMKLSFTLKLEKGGLHHVNYLLSIFINAFKYLLVLQVIFIRFLKLLDDTLDFGRVNYCDILYVCCFHHKCVTCGTA